MSSSSSNILVVGCGLMGSSIAKMLSASGCKVAAWNRTHEAAERLSAFGVTSERCLSASIKAADYVFLVVSNYEICKTILNGHEGCFAGKVVINLTSGTSEQAEEVGAIVSQANAQYLDGSIWAMPNGIGSEGTCLAYSGASPVWEGARAILMHLGGASRHVGESFSSANVLEAAFPGTFYMTSILSFIEGIALCKAYGITEQTILEAVAPTIALLQSNMTQTVKKIFESDFDTDQATLDVFHSAVKSYRANLHSPVKDSPLNQVLVKILEQAGEDGLAQKDVAVYINYLKKNIN